MRTFVLAAMLMTALALGWAVDHGASGWWLPPAGYALAGGFAVLLVRWFGVGAQMRRGDR